MKPYRNSAPIRRVSRWLNRWRWAAPRLRRYWPACAVVTVVLTLVYLVQAPNYEAAKAHAARLCAADPEGCRAGRIQYTKP